MKLLYRLTAALLCLSILLSLCACGSNDPQATTQPPSTTAATEVTAGPTEPAADYLALYTAARESLSSAQAYTVNYTFDLSRLVNGETYTQNRTGSGLYQDLTEEDPRILITEDLTYGTFFTSYTQAYQSGVGYSSFGRSNFRCEIDLNGFLAQQIPAVLLDEALYSDLSVISDGALGSDTLLCFSGAASAESWLSLQEEAEFLGAEGIATLNSSNQLIAATYHCKYRISTATYTLDVSVELTTDTAELAWPEFPADATAISDLRIPLYLLQCVGDVYTSRAMSVSYCDTLYSQALGEVRIQNSSYYTYGADADFMATLYSQVSTTNYVGTTTNEQTITYRDGIYSTSVNGSTPTSYSDISAQKVRTSCEDAILSALFQPNFIAGAQITDTGDFLCIRFTGNETYASSICAGIYALYSMDLDSFAASYSTGSAEGYLTINKYTGLPTAMGMSVSRTHIIDGIAYSLTYQLDQAIELSSLTAYESITGEPAPDETAESATPLLYKVTGADGQTLYLFGTIHVGDSRTANLPQELADAFAASDALALEFDTQAFEEAVLTDEALQAQIGQLYYDVSKTVEQRLGSTLYAQAYPLMLATGQNNINSPYLRISIWQNLIENFFLAQGSSLTASKGMESRLLSWAQDQQKPVYEIESGLSQLTMLTGFSQDLQKLLLQQSLDAGLLTYCAESQNLYDLWCQGDADALTQLLSESEDLTESEQLLYGEYYQAMYTDRNARMLTAATGYLSSGETVFLAVGLAHLLGEDGLVAGLTAAGYTIEQVVYK